MNFTWSSLSAMWHFVRWQLCFAHPNNGRDRWTCNLSFCCNPRNPPLTFYLYSLTKKLITPPDKQYPAISDGICVRLLRSFRQTMRIKRPADTPALKSHAAWITRRGGDKWKWYHSISADLLWWQRTASGVNPQLPRSWLTNLGQDSRLVCLLSWLGGLAWICPRDCGKISHWIQLIF